MKKFMIACLILFIANVGCKKMNVDGGGLCGCSPVAAPSLNLAVTNAAGDDLLSDKTTGAYAKDKIQIYRKDAAGKMTAVYFDIRPPFSYGDEKFKYNTLYISGIQYNQDTKTDVIYLKLGDDQPLELSMQLKPEGQLSVQQLLIDQKEALKEAGNITKFVSVFYLKK